MKQDVSPVLIGVIVAVLVLVLGFFAWKTFGPVSKTGGGSNPYAGKPEMKNLKPGENPTGGYMNRRGPGMGSGGPGISSGGPGMSSGGPAPSSSGGPPPQ